MKDLKTVHTLGWVSLAIAATEIFGQGAVENDFLGVDEHRQLLRALGMREAAAGITLLSQRRITPTLAAGLWSRVAGDAMDLALLAAGAPKSRKPSRFAAATLLVLGITALDVFYAFRIQRRLVMAKFDVKHRAALDDRSSPAAQPPPRGVPAPV
ncbi:MAG TPA: hypothetical protein VG326_21230 [Tepidisphaeraceae bacterium]|nr:hypothetical protein [Tepidisphaeraceae bacterium]